MIPTIFNATQSNNYLLVLKYLTEYENDPNERDENGLTCLHYCATYGHLETAKVLVSYGAALDLKDLTSGWTALHRSIYFQHLKLSLFLIQMGARLDANDSTTPSASNAHRSNSEQLDLDLKIRDNEGRTPLDLLSYQLKNDLKMHGKRESTTNGVNYQGIIMSFGKADFTLGVPLPKSSDVSRPKRLDSLLQENILDFSAAKFHAIAVTKEGEVYSWGNGKSGKLGQGNEISQPEPALITSLSLGKIRVRKVCAAESHSLALTDQGSVYSWGSDRFGQLGHGGQQDSNRWIAVPKRIEILRKENVIGIAAGDQHSLCYTSDSKVFAWGSNKAGQLGINPSELSSGAAGVNCSYVPKRITLPFLTVNSRTRFSTSTTYEIRQITAAYQSSLILCSCTQDVTDSRWRGEGLSEVYQWGDGTCQMRRVFLNPRTTSAKRGKSNEFASNASFLQSSYYHDVNHTDPMNITQIAAGKFHYVALSSLGFVYTWGLGCDQLGHSFAASSSESESSKFLSNAQIVDGLLPENGGGKVVFISASGNRTCAVTKVGDLFTWGATTDKGILTSSAAVSYQPVPKKVYDIKRAVKVTAGEDYTLVLTSITLPSPFPFPCDLEQTSKVKSAVRGIEEDYQYGDDLYYSSLKPQQVEDVPKLNIPSLQHLCAEKLCSQVTLKNVLNGLVFAERFNSELLIEYCTEYIQRNLDAVIVQTKAVELERIMEELMNTQSVMKKRKESFSVVGVDDSSYLRQRKDSKDITGPVRRVSSLSIAEKEMTLSVRKGSIELTKSTPTMILTEKKDFMGIDNSQDMMKAIRAVKKKLQSIEQIEEKMRNDVSYKLSKEQEGKLSKKSELQSELSKMDQYLQRLLNREKMAENSINVPAAVVKEEKEEILVSSPKILEKAANEVIVQELEEKKDTGSSNIGKKKSKKVKYTPLDLTMIPSSSTPSIQPPIVTTKPSIPTSFAQWSTIFATDSASPTSTNIVAEKDSADVETSKIGADMKKISISSSFGGGRTVLSPLVTGTSKAANIPPTLSSSTKPSSIASPQSKLANSSSPAAPTTGNSNSGFSLADFLTPKKQQNNVHTATTPNLSIEYTFMKLSRPCIP
eukprot:CAMPEP_0173134324 /NCGR_PEP_ID=MMETSP1105-20130129/1224_1 /TAXON_ID=2985 /ORGANISM="Ochromonas sp., Strain BG-1" /LENGTH=1098 /DNA_ID=CAMNT_0014046101 /DNA_START=281 /DNA_END=3577 /DNA_ORIENTATION=+